MWTAKPYFSSPLAVQSHLPSKRSMFSAISMQVMAIVWSQLFVSKCNKSSSSDNQLVEGLQVRWSKLHDKCNLSLSCLIYHHCLHNVYMIIHILVAPFLLPSKILVSILPKTPNCSVLTKILILLCYKLLNTENLYIFSNADKILHVIYAFLYVSLFCLNLIKVRI